VISLIHIVDINNTLLYLFQFFIVDFEIMIYFELLIKTMCVIIVDITNSK